PGWSWCARSPARCRSRAPRRPARGSAQPAAHAIARRAARPRRGWSSAAGPGRPRDSGCGNRRPQRTSRRTRPWLELPHARQHLRAEQLDGVQDLVATDWRREDELQDAGAQLVPDLLDLLERGLGRTGDELAQLQAFFQIVGLEPGALRLHVAAVVAGAGGALVHSPVAGAVGRPALVAARGHEILGGLLVGIGQVDGGAVQHVIRCGLQAGLLRLLAVVLDGLLGEGHGREGEPDRDVVAGSELARLGAGAGDEDGWMRLLDWPRPDG